MKPKGPSSCSRADRTRPEDFRFGRLTAPAMPPSYDAIRVCIACRFLATRHGQALQLSVGSELAVFINDDFLFCEPDTELTLGARLSQASVTSPLKLAPAA
jgi:hypothetical protein